MSFYCTPYFRARIIQRASSLVATKYRYKSLAICMVGQAKTAQQADIDCIAELVDFLRFNIKYGMVRDILFIHKKY